MFHVLHHYTLLCTSIIFHLGYYKDFLTASIFALRQFIFHMASRMVITTNPPMAFFHTQTRIHTPKIMAYKALNDLVCIS